MPITRRKTGKPRKPRGGDQAPALRVNPMGMQVIPRLMGGIHHFSRWATSSSLTVTSTSQSGGSISLNNNGLLTLTTSAVQDVFFYSLSVGFALEDLPNYADFTGLFERYRIKSVTLVMTPFATTSVAPSAAGNGTIGGFVHSVADYNDVGVLAASTVGIGNMRERPTFRTVNVVSREPYMWRLQPRVAVPAYAAATFSGYTNVASPWIDTISTDVEHYGMKYIFEVANTSAVVQYVSFKLELRYDMEFSDVK